MSETVNAKPEKEFFIRMITKDISLEACIFDLLDNSLDGATATKKKSDYSGFWAKLRISKSEFSIEDNCGGIPIDVAKNYAFRLGKSQDAVHPNGLMIGHYGIGMKRAMFKIGRDIAITSYAKAEAFKISIDVDAWGRATDWDFALDPIKTRSTPGTKLRVVELNDDAASAFGDAVFRNGLAQQVARAYSRFLDEGFVIELNGIGVAAAGLTFRKSKDFAPLRKKWKDGAVAMEIVAGAAAFPPDEDAALDEDAESDSFGWYVVCNGRVIIGGDKTEKTVWGDDKFPIWHPQYKGFVGVLTMEGPPGSLPWNTTKTDIEPTSALYRRAIVRMKQATRPYLAYTRKRKANLPAAKRAEEKTKVVPVEQILKSEEMAVPDVPSASDVVRIVYDKPRRDVDRAARALGNPRLAARNVGSKTFEYFLEHELGE